MSKDRSVSVNLWQRWNRRELLQRATVAGLLGRTDWGQAQTPPGLIARQQQPDNLEAPFSALDSYVTPNQLFYVRNHFAMPAVDGAAYRLKVDGTVGKPLELTLDDLKQMPSRTQPATLECAGNSRRYLQPAVKGVQWELGAVSHAEWTGVPLREVLERAGVRAGALEVVAAGGDSGEPGNDPKPPGGTAFARSLPLKKALGAEVLLAWSMNGADLPLAHGAPLRLVVPGYYGMASVKWLKQITVLTEPFTGYWQTTDYAFWDRSGVIPVRRPLLDMTVKSLIARPSAEEKVVAGAAYRVRGAAWSGDADVVKVEMSVDGGKAWMAAKLIDKPVRFAWRRWEWEWKAPAAAGPVTLMSRATDSAGNVQPTAHNRDTGSYAIHHVLPVQVTVG